jgi:hypothetical protein
VFDFTNDKESSFEPIPAGVYNVRVAACEAKKTQAGDLRWAVEFVVTEGPHTGRKIFDGFNLEGSEKAVQIARGNIKSLLKAAGKDFSINGPEDLVDIEVSASIKIKAPQNGYDAKNTLSSFKPKVATQESSEVPF